MTDPVRLQLSRVNGFDLQAHSRAVNGLEAVNCARPGRWGNRWKLGDRQIDWVFAGDRPIETQEQVVAAFRKQYLTALSSTIGDVSKHLREALDEELRGKNLACWCGPDAHCHADVLLELANK